MAHVLLIGFMGAGKSTVGRLIAKRLGLPFRDTDEMVERAAGRSVREIFEQDGEPAFREQETDALRALEDAEPSVVACGGGIVTTDASRALLEGLGTVVYLRVSAAETLARVGNDETRPLLSGPGGQLAASVLLEAREALYCAAADFVVDTAGLTAEQVAEQVLLGLEELDAE
jgi:shikimate kinase